MYTRRLVVLTMKWIEGGGLRGRGLRGEVERDGEGERDHRRCKVYKKVYVVSARK